LSDSIKLRIVGIFNVIIKRHFKRDFLNFFGSKEAMYNEHLKDVNFYGKT